jgi:hypothetical protein
VHRTCTQRRLPQWPSGRLWRSTFSNARKPSWMQELTVSVSGDVVSESVMPDQHSLDLASRQMLFAVQFVAFAAHQLVCARHDQVVGAHGRTSCNCGGRMHTRQRACAVQPSSSIAALLLVSSDEGAAFSRHSSCRVVTFNVLLPLWELMLYIMSCSCHYACSGCMQSLALQSHYGALKSICTAAKCTSHCCAPLSKRSHRGLPVTVSSLMPARHCHPMRIATKQRLAG